MSGISVTPGPEDVKTIVTALDQRGTVYRGDGYSGLICPARVDLEAGAVPRLVDEMNAIWQWNRVWHDLYAADPTVRALSDYGVSDKALRVQRRMSVLRREPEVARVDSVALHPHQAVAEVQWKGGGEGFSAGLQDAYLEELPCRTGEEPLGGVLVESWSRLYGRHGSFVITSTRDTWMRSEQFLIEALRDKGIDLLFVPRHVIAEHIRVRDGHVEAECAGSWRRVDYLSLDRISEALPNELYTLVIDCYERGAIHLEPPPSYLYSQKLGYALPWHPEYRHAFSDDVRAVMIPTVCLNEGPQSLARLPVKHPESDRLAEVRDWDDVQALPERLRRSIVVKCASINGSLNHGGRGVWRLGTPATLAAVVKRVERGEPWIAQPYLDRTWRVPLAMPPDGDIATRRTHARFCLYAGLDDRPWLLGGLVTFSTFWKSAGKSAYLDDHGRIAGSAFVDLRVQH